MSISVRNLSKFYGTQQALKDVSFDIKKGEIVGFLGPNGAGKSTLMKILTTYLPPTEGTAIVNGFDVSTNPLDVQKSIGYLPEHNPLYLEMYVREYLEFNLKIYKVSTNRIDEVIQMTGLVKERHKKIGQLSKGYRQRVGLAAALLHDPDILILDEPTTGLDPSQIIEIRQLIQTISASKIVFLSTHIMQEVEAVCDRVLIISQGVLVADKKLTELLDATTQVIEVEFDYRVEEAFLLQLPHVSTVTNPHDFFYEVTFNTSIDMRPAIFDFAHDNQLKTLQLSRRNQNLEDLFIELTS